MAIFQFAMLNYRRVVPRRFAAKGWKPLQVAVELLAEMHGLMAEKFGEAMELGISGTGGIQHPEIYYWLVVTGTWILFFHSVGNHHSH